MCSEKSGEAKDEGVHIDMLKILIGGRVDADASIHRLEGNVVGAIANALCQSHTSSQRRKKKDTWLELFFKMLQAMSKSNHHFPGKVLEGGPIIVVVTEREIDGEVVQGLNVGPQFDAEFVVE
jgi:hypothetical protein